MATESEWREKQGKNIKNVPWRPMKINNCKYLIKTIFTENSYEVAVTNLKHLWFEKLDEAGILQRHQKLNPSVEAPIEKVVNHIKGNIESAKEDVEYNIVFVQDLLRSDWGRKMTLRMTSKLSDVPFEWRFVTCPDNPNYLIETVTLPLMCMTSELLRRQTELVRRLEEKDAHIDAMKTVGVRSAKAKQLETGTFDLKAFNHQMALSKEFEAHAKAVGEATWSREGQDLYEDCQLKRAWATRPFHPTEGEDGNDSQSATNDEPEQKVTESPATELKTDPEEQERREILEKRLAEATETKAVKKQKKVIAF